MAEPLKWYDEKADNSPWINALAEVRQGATREGYCYQHVQAITVATDQYAEKALWQPRLLSQQALRCRLIGSASVGAIYRDVGWIAENIRPKAVSVLVSGMKMGRSKTRAKSETSLRLLVLAALLLDALGSYEEPSARLHTHSMLFLLLAPRTPCVLPAPPALVS